MLKYWMCISILSICLHVNAISGRFFFRVNRSLDFIYGFCDDHIGSKWFGGSSKGGLGDINMIALGFGLGVPLAALLVAFLLFERILSQPVNDYNASLGLPTVVVLRWSELESALQGIYNRNSWYPMRLILPRSEILASYNKANKGQGAYYYSYI